MSRSRAAALALAALVSGCGGAEHLDRVDIDQRALDVDACARGESSCARTGRVTSVESFVPGDGHAVRLDPGGAIEGPLMRPSPTARLAMLVLGYRAVGDEGVPRELRLGLASGGSAPRVGLVSIKTTNASFRVVEVSELDAVPPADAHVRIESTTGVIEVIYVIGRWKN